MKDNTTELTLPDNYSLQTAPNDQFLRHIWQYQYFNKQSLKLDNGDELQVIHPGRYDPDSAHRFIEAKINIAGTLWVGNIELYLNTSNLLTHWLKHDHYKDNIILYVVWDNDLPNSDFSIPVFSLNLKPSPISQPILEKGKRQIDNKNESKEPNYMDIPNSEIGIINCLHELIGTYKKKDPIIRGEIHSLKINTWLRETSSSFIESCGHFKEVPKILLLGDWLTQAGFECGEYVHVIPLRSMLIIIPQKQ